MEYFDVVDENDKIIGKASRKECHSDNSLIHRGVDVLIFNSKGQLLLQKRSMKKDLYPGLWTCSATGHNDLGESYQKAAEREVMEEIGVKIPLSFCCSYKLRSRIESENLQVFTGRHDGPFKSDKEEVDEVKFSSVKEVKRMIAEKKHVTPGLTMAFGEYLKCMKEKEKRW